MKEHAGLTKLPVLLVAGSICLLVLSILIAYVPKGEPSALPAMVLTTAINTPGATATIFATPTTIVLVDDKHEPDRQRLVELTEIALTPRPTQHWPLPTATPNLTPPWPPGEPYRLAGAGAIHAGQPPTSAAGFTMGNTWSEMLSDRIIIVYAGGEGYMGDRTQGELFISARTLNSHLISEDLYRTPTKRGPVAVIGAVGERLTLRADDGTLFYFDVATRQWVNP